MNPKLNNDNLFLDDVRTCPRGWKLVRSFTQFERYIKLFSVPPVISFDHDLGIEHYRDANESVIDYSQYNEKTGYDCAKLLIERNEFPKLAIVHSFNPAGAQNIAGLLSPHCVVLIQPYRPENYYG